MDRLDRAGAVVVGLVTRVLLAAACFVLALGLPFGRAVRAVVPAMVLAQPILVTEPGTRGFGPNGEVLAIPGRLRMQYVPLLFPAQLVTSGDAPLGRTSTARVPLVALLAASLLAWKRRSPKVARRAALAGGLALAATGVAAALPTAGAVAAVLGLVLLASWAGREVA